MHYCRTCKKPLGGHLHLANDNPEPIVIPGEEILARQSSIIRVAMLYKAKGIASRKIVDFIADHMNGCTTPVFRDGIRVCVDSAVVDEVFRTDEDPSERWLRSFLAFAVKPPIQRAQDRVLPRLTLLWLAWAIHSPTQAEMAIR